MRMLVKRDLNKPYIIVDFMVTSLSEAKFNKLKELNKQVLSDYVMVPQNEIDYTWWFKVSKKLTEHKITECYIDFDQNGRMYTY